MHASLITVFLFTFLCPFYLHVATQNSPTVTPLPSELMYSQLNSHELLGSGRYGAVYRVTFKRPLDGNKFKGHSVAAAKSLFKLNKTEVHILRTVKHRNIVKFLAYIQEGMNAAIVTELADESLRDRLDKQKGKLSGRLQEKWIRESAEATQYLHNGIPNENGEINPVAHRDLKASNCLLFGNVLKLCDFGISRETARDDSGNCYSIN